MDLELDHVVLAAPDLEQACQRFAEATGCTPRAGGAHPGLGTRNALASVASASGAGCYLELIAPDPEQPSADNLAARLRELDQTALFHWALRSRDLEAVARALRTRGLSPTGRIETRRRAPCGGELVWDLMGLPQRGGAWPFFIDWRACPHPSADAPSAGRLGQLEVSLPHDPAAPGADGRDLFRGLAGVALHDGPPALALRLDGGRGPVTWQRAAPAGFFG